MKGLSLQKGSHSTGKLYDASQALYEQKFDFMNIHGDVMFNMSNLLFGYNEKRIWNVTPYAGLGWMVTWDTPRAREFNANLGLINSFRLCSALDLNLDVRATATKDGFDGEIGGRKEEGLLAITLGLELQGHGGPVILDLLLKRILLIDNIRIANPGEFSERAFLNDKLDLAQAEAIADLIDASSEQAARSAMNSLQGAFSGEVHQMVEALTNLRI